MIYKSVFNFVHKLSVMWALQQFSQQIDTCNKTQRALFFLFKYFENVVHFVLTNYCALDCALYQLAVQYFLTAYNVMIKLPSH